MRGKLKLLCKSINRIENTGDIREREASDFFSPLFRKHITDAMVVTYIHKDYMVGEHARCLYKLSQASYQDVGKELEAGSNVARG